MGKQCDFSVDSTGIARHGSLRADYSVARDDNTDRISAYCTADSLG